MIRIFATVPRMPFARSMGTRSFVILIAIIVTSNSCIASESSCSDSLVSEEGSLTFELFFAFLELLVFGFIACQWTRVVDSESQSWNEMPPPASSHWRV
ncbi:hypothetical protein EV424DRAFT_1429407, partial [Suillus variegatus]